MDEIMLDRLRLITEKIKDLTNSALEFSDQNFDIEKVEIIVKKLEVYLNRFESELQNYFRLSTEPSPDDVSSFSEIQLRGEDVLSELTVKLKGIKDKIIPSVIQTENSIASSSKLPKLSLPEFGGDILEWHQFWDQFHSNVGRRNLSEVDKLLYLKASLKGDAKKVVDGLEITNKNYEIAVSTLKTRYGKENHIIDAHYAALSRINRIPTGKDITEVRNTYNEIERHLRVLKSLGEDVNHNHLRFLIMEKFPEDIIYEMKMKVDTESIEEIRKQLEIIITAREDAKRMTTEDSNLTGETSKGEYTTQSLHTYNITNKRGKFKKFIKTNDRNFRTKLQKPIFHENKRKNINYNDRDKLKNQLKRKFEHPKIKEEVPERKRRRLQCIFCEEAHYNDQCTKFITPEERKSKLQKRCYGCLAEGHLMKHCKRKLYCVHCKSTKHNRALCPKRFKKENEQTSTLHMTTTSSTILQTAVVKAQHGEDDSIHVPCRVLLDSGSQRTYITKTLAKKLNLTIEEESRLSVFTFGSKTPQILESDLVKLQIQTRTKDTLVFYANVVPYISQGIPHTDLELSKWNKELILADDGSLLSQIDMLIGNDYYFTLMSGGKIELDNNLFLVESKLGWILTGKPNVKTVDNLSAVTYFQTSAENKLTQPDLPLDTGNLKCLWDLESIGICDSPKVTRDEETIKYFNDTIKLINGRYTVSWPWIEYPPNLPSNFGLAFGRLVNLLKRLNSETLSAYEEILNEQLEKGIIEILPESEIETEDIDHPIHYIPHHGVLHPGKPIRIVYDASAKTKDNKSLNECLHCGPLMLEDLTGMILRFRSHQIGITADVEKAFLQIALHDNDKDVTRFLWLKDITKPATKDNLLHLRFCRVPFGIISSPFLLNATLKHHLLNSNKDNMKRIVNDIYVDNLVTGIKNTEEAMTLYKTSKETFKDISMNLRDWTSNSKEFLKNIPQEDTCEDNKTKVLGLIWNTKMDTIQLNPKKITEANSKRKVLKIVASIYDPCGYVVPELLPAKIFLQKLWIEKLKWDTPLNTDLTNEWLDIAKDLENVEDFILPRRYFENEDESNIQLHCFTDASTKAYAAVIYITNGKEISFVIGKSRLVPLKDQDDLKIPRLELLGVLIGSRLLKYVTKYLHFEFQQLTIWTDSQIVIDWFYSNKLLPPFIARRIEEIKRNKSITIRHVPTNMNPADVATRPTSSREEKKSWLSGPKYLLDDSKTWPTSRRSELFLLCGEDLTNLTNYNEEQSETQDPNIQNPQEHIEQKSPEAIDELDSKISIKTCEEDSTPQLQKIKRIQSEYFPEELEGKETNLKRNLGLFIDIDGILRCKGRLKYTNWSYDKRYPILIPKNCDFTNELILKTHEENYHVGVNHTLSLIRLSYWIPQGRSQVQKILRKCKSCIKHGGGPYKLPPTPALPKERVNYSSPFTYTGIDYLGPLCVKLENKTEKRWICLYTCLAIRAIHLEVVKDLTAEECILALRRFISARGVPAVITSDNATQFKLSAEVLSDSYCINNEIKWKFIPQLAPWHGGFYERLVGLVKHCLKRTLTKHLLTDSQLLTIMKEIEAILNTRPLTCVGSELEDILRPSDFLTLGKCIVTEASDQIPQREGTSTKQNLIEGWKRGQTMLSEFKRMFIDQYLPSLRERYQHSHKEPRILKLTEPKLGDIVQIKSDTKNRENWKVGKIVSLLKSSDGQCRVARVKVNDTEFTRSINHLYPLEITDDLPETEESTHEYKKQSTAPIMFDLPEPEDDNSTLHPDYTTEPTEAVLIPDDEVIPESTVKDDTSKQFEIKKVSEEFDKSRSDDIKNMPESTESKEKDNPHIKETRNASAKAREKIREWTRELMNSL